jgi:hypothetical protein
MSRVALAFTMAFASLVLGVGLRWLAVEVGGFGPEDLARFKSQSGIDVPDEYGKHPFFLAWSRGDGQVFVIQAVDPLVRGPGQLVHEPAYRYLRIGFPLLARLAVGWNVALVPIGFVIVNGVAIMALGGLVGWKYPDWGSSAAAAAHPGCRAGFVYDSAEVVGTLAVLLVVLFARYSGWWGVLVGLIRPSYLTGVFLSRGWKATTATTVIAAVAVQMAVVVALGLPWDTAGAGNLTFPLVGYVVAWPDQTAPTRIVSLLIATVAGLTLVATWRSRSSHRWAIAAASSAGLALILSELVVSNPGNLLRAAGMLAFVWLIPPDSQHACSGSDRKWS